MMISECILVLMKSHEGTLEIALAVVILFAALLVSMPGVTSWEMCPRVCTKQILPIAMPQQDGYQIVTRRELEQGSGTQWNNKKIMYTGTFESGLERSDLDRLFWVSFGGATESLYAQAQEIARKQGLRSEERNLEARVTMYGTVHAGDPSRYGHMGIWPYELVVDRIEAAP